MNFDDWKKFDDEICSSISEATKALEKLKYQREGLKADYIQQNALPVGTPVIPNRGRLKDVLCHIYEVDFYSWDPSIFVYAIRKAKKNGDPAANGKSAWGLSRNEFRVVEGAS